MIITIFGFCPYGPVIIYRMGGGREEITWFSGGEDAGGGGVRWILGRSHGFQGGRWGVRRILGRSHGFQREKKGGGGNRSSPTESKGGILENRLPPIFPIPLDEKKRSAAFTCFSVSTNNVIKEKKISNIGPTNVSGVIDFENKLSPESDVTVQTSTRNTNDQIRNQEREKRRQEMEKRKDERKKEMERRRLEREKQRIAKQSSPKRFTDLVVPQGDPDQGEFEQWEELDESPSSPRSDVTVREHE